MVTKITVEEALKLDAIFIDTRTPKEYEEDHLPNAINVPIFSNEERAIIGKIYKQVSQEKAIEKGIEYFSKKLPGFMDQVNQFKDKQIIFYCWRGGMRSKTVVSLLESLKYNVMQLEGGHKEYRKHVREQLQNYNIKPKFIVLHGLTCTGKTQLLQNLPNSIDLEGLAQHRSSLYGAIGLKPNSQKKFENLILQRLNKLQKEEYVFIEGESRRIGDVIIPEILWKAMKKGVHVKITRNLQNRAKAGVKEYCNTPEKIIKTREVTKSLFKVISKKNKHEIVDLIDQKDYQKAVEILLEFYYDPLYSHSLDKIKYNFEIDNNDVEKALHKLQTLIQPLNNPLNLIN
jgi:tRNA 2-selenouridine synthase